ncbi:glycosyltransferase family 10 domain-containing protein [Vibrio sp. T187]|uniref:glycosyltransferase family 10 domain-containing protein n=1 Tax=Vibrio sp. T187 TaxID=2497751 RepID=UPI001C580E82|nr:glycosyltransferase family 10 [Vibrio sp. T187]
MKDFLKQMGHLKSVGQQSGINFYTSDEIDITEVSCVIFIDCPEPHSDFYTKVVNNNIEAKLMVWESGIINPRNIDTSYHEYFTTVFTYDDDLVDNSKYVKLCYAFDFPVGLPSVPFETKKLCCLISGNKFSEHPLELYSKRLEFIHWFENNQPTSFDLYGQGWNKIVPPRNVFHRIINRFPALTVLRGVGYSTYKGEVDCKLDIYRGYKFSLCYENAVGLTGYVSEKIFDCLFSGCVPIYLGADNISEHIPRECFIDMREFDSISELFEYMESMSDLEYSIYQKSISDFLEKGRNGIFSLDYFSSTIIGELNNEV